VVVVMVMVMEVVVVMNEGGDDGWIVFESNDDVSDNDFLL